ncbi:MAG: flippase [Candidatus Magasanikbacteria bacterium]|nr:flippase [Candidatus Magasanikbacteria bacterium]
MSEVRKIAHNTAWQLGGKIFSTALGLIAVAIMTRTLGVEKFGWYSTAVGFLQFIGIFTDFGFTVVTANMLSEPAHDKKQLLNNLFTWRVITALLTQGLAPLTIFFFPYPAAIKWAVVIMAFSFVSISLNQVFVAYYQTKLAMHIQAIGEVIGRVVLVAGLALAALGNYGFLPMMIAITVSSFAYTGYLWFRAEPLRFQINSNISKAIYKKIWPVALAVVFNCFYLQGDRLILPLFVSQTEVGLYGASYRVIDIVLAVSTMIIGILLPLITFAYSRNLREKFVEQSQRAFDLMALFILPIIAGALVLAEPIMRFVAGSDFSSSGKFLQIQILTMVGISFGIVSGHINLAINRQKSALWVYIVCAILSVIAYLIFIPKFGGFGAAWTRVGSEIFAGAGLTIAAGIFSGFWPRLGAFAKILISSAVMGYAVYIIQPFNLFASIIIGIFVYSILVLVFRVISKQTLLEAFPFLNKLM